MEVKFCTSFSMDLFGCNSKSLRSSFYCRIRRSFKLRVKIMESSATSNEKECMKTTIKPSYADVLKSTPGKWLPIDDGIIVISERSRNKEGEVKVKEKLDKYLVRVLYGSKESSLPVFKKLCRE